MDSREEAIAAIAAAAAAAATTDTTTRRGTALPAGEGVVDRHPLALLHLLDSSGPVQARSDCSEPLPHWNESMVILASMAHGK
jgi:hypothetical protein